MAVPSTATKTTEGKTTQIAVPAPTITPAPAPNTITTPKVNPYAPAPAGTTATLPVTTTTATAPTTTEKSTSTPATGVTAATPQPTPILIGDGGSAPATTAPAATPPAAAPATTGAGVTPTPAPSVAPTLTPTNPAAPLTTQTISPGPAIDRFKLAMDRFGTWKDATRPEYDATLRDAARMAAATGGLGSGELRTRYGNLGLARDTMMRAKEQELFQDALLGTVDDARFATGVAQQQQGFQDAQQQRLFENELRRMGFSEDLINSQFGRALQMYMAGQAGGTGSSTAMAGASAAGEEGNDALSALYKYLQDRARTTGTGATGGVSA